VNRGTDFSLIIDPLLPDGEEIFVTTGCRLIHGQPDHLIRDIINISSPPGTGSVPEPAPVPFSMQAAVPAPGWFCCCLEVREEREGGRLLPAPWLLENKILFFSRFPVNKYSLRALMHERR